MTIPEIALTEVTGPEAAPILVLGHSLGTGSLIWEHVVPLMRREYRVILLTLPGHPDGEGIAPVPVAPFTMAELATAVATAVAATAATAVAATAAATAIQRPRGATHPIPVYYAGVSIGGVLGLQLALDYPDVFAGVACFASGAQMGSAEHWEARAATVREQTTSVLIPASSKAWFAPESLEREPVMIERILRTLRLTTAEGYARCAEALGGVSLLESLERIEIPVLAAWGEFDTVATEEMQDVIVSRVQRGTKIRIDGVAHQPPAERPDATAAALLEYFAGL